MYEEKKINLGIDIGGTFTKFGVVENGKIIHHSKIQTNWNLFNKWIKHIILEIQFIKKKYTINKIAISTTGVVNYDGLMLTANDYGKKYIGTNWKQIIDDNFGINTFSHALNDADALALFQLSTCKYNDIVSVTVGTGVGLSVIQNRKLIKGHDYIIGEIGSLFWKDKKNIDQYFNATSLNNKILKKYESFSFKNLFIAYEDDEFKIIIDDWANEFSKLLIWNILLLSPEIIYISGGISYSGEFLLDLIKLKINNNFPKHLKYSTKIELASEKNDANILGLFVN